MTTWVALTAPALAGSAGALARFPALMDTLVGGHYESARAICAEIRAEFPDHPAALYAEAAVNYAHMVDLEDTVGRGQFMALTDSAVERCDELRKAQTENPSVIAFLRGSALGARGLLLNHEGKAIPGIRLLIRAKGEFEKAIQEDPELYDAYLGRGAYRYAVATHASVLKWLPFIPTKSAGLEDLWLAASRSRFSRSAAWTSIAWHMMDEDEFALADSVIQLGLRRFPECRNFLWPELAFHERQNHWAKAEQTALQLVRQYEQHPDNNGYETIGLYWRLMTCADALGRAEDAKTYARSGTGAFRTAEVAERRADKLREMESRLSNP